MPERLRYLKPAERHREEDGFDADGDHHRFTCPPWRWADRAAARCWWRRSKPWVNATIDNRRPPMKPIHRRRGATADASAPVAGPGGRRPDPGVTAEGLAGGGSTGRNNRTPTGTRHRLGGLPNAERPSLPDIGNCLPAHLLAAHLSGHSTTRNHGRTGQTYPSAACWRRTLEGLPVGELTIGSADTPPTRHP